MACSLLRLMRPPYTLLAVRRSGDRLDSWEHNGQESRAELASSSGSLRPNVRTSRPPSIDPTGAGPLLLLCIGAARIGDPPRPEFLRLGAGVRSSVLLPIA